MRNKKQKVNGGREEFYNRLGDQALSPLWEVIWDLLKNEPVTAAVPHCWRYDAVRPFVMEAGDIISAAEAERRVLILENPGLKGRNCMTETLYAGLQLVLPGEIAPSHRHTPSALRFVLEGEGGYTAVDGEKAYMKPGDLILTPNWAWHEHGNESDQPVIWLDGLDLPLMGTLGPVFTEVSEDNRLNERPPGDVMARYGVNMKKIGDRHDKAYSPLFHYPYETARRALAELANADDIDARHGVKYEYINPRTGGPVMPTLSAYLQLLPAGFQGTPYRSTDAGVFSVVEGNGRTEIETAAGTMTLEWGPRDHFVVPLWHRYRLIADEEAVLFSFSDRALQENLGLWREESGL